MVKKVNYLKSLEKDLESAQEKYKTLDEINMVNCQKLRELEVSSDRELGELEGKVFEARKLGIDRGNEVRGLEGENERLLREIGELRERTDELVKRSEMLGVENEVLVAENESLSEQLSRKEIGECFGAGARDLPTFRQMDSVRVGTTEGSGMDTKGAKSDHLSDILLLEVERVTEENAGLEERCRGKDLLLGEFRADVEKLVCRMEENVYGCVELKEFHGLCGEGSGLESGKLVKDAGYWWDRIFGKFGQISQISQRPEGEDKDTQTDFCSNPESANLPPLIGKGRDAAPSSLRDTLPSERTIKTQKSDKNMTDTPRLELDNQTTDRDPFMATPPIKGSRLNTGVSIDSHPGTDSANQNLVGLMTSGSLGRRSTSVNRRSYQVCRDPGSSKKSEGSRSPALRISTTPKADSNFDADQPGDSNGGNFGNRNFRRSIDGSYGNGNNNYNVGLSGGQGGTQNSHNHTTFGRPDFGNFGFGVKRELYQDGNEDTVSGECKAKEGVEIESTNKFNSTDGGFAEDRSYDGPLMEFEQPNSAQMIPDSSCKRQSALKKEKVLTSEESISLSPGHPQKKFKEDNLIPPIDLNFIKSSKSCQITKGAPNVPIQKNPKRASTKKPICAQRQSNESLEKKLDIVTAAFNNSNSDYLIDVDFETWNVRQRPPNASPSNLSPETLRFQN